LHHLDDDSYVEIEQEPKASALLLTAQENVSADLVELSAEDLLPGDTMIKAERINPSENKWKITASGDTKGMWLHRARFWSFLALQLRHQVLSDLFLHELK